MPVSSVKSTANFVLRINSEKKYKTLTTRTPKEKAVSITTELTVHKQRTREGFGVHYQTLDHLATHRLLEQMLGVVVATVDFMKAFD